MDLGIDPFQVLTVVDYGDAEVVPADPKASHEALRRAVGDVYAAGAVPIVLGGDHSIAHPDVGALADHLRQTKPGASLGLVHFDAHADDAPDLYGVTLSHGTALRLLVEEGSLEGRNIVQVGLRGYWPDPEDFAWAREQGFRWHLMEEITERGIRSVRRLAWQVGLAGMEVVEVSPPYDHAEITALLAHRLVLEALSGLALRKLGRDPAPEKSG